MKRGVMSGIMAFVMAVFGLFVFTICTPQAFAQYKPTGGSDHAEIGAFSELFRVNQSQTNLVGVGARLSVNFCRCFSLKPSQHTISIKCSRKPIRQALSFNAQTCARSTDCLVRSCRPTRTRALVSDGERRSGGISPRPRSGDDRQFLQQCGEHPQPEC